MSSKENQCDDDKLKNIAELPIPTSEQNVSVQIDPELLLNDIDYLSMELEDTNILKTIDTNSTSNFLSENSSEQPSSTSLTNEMNTVDGSTNGKYQSLIFCTFNSKTKLYNCDLCKYKSKVKRLVIEHVRTHTGEKPFKCLQCGYKCVTEPLLKEHNRIHTGEKPYSCEICNYQSAQKSTYKMHLRTHTGEKPFSCTFCDYKTTQNGALKRHVFAMHRGKRKLRLRRTQSE